MFQRKKQSNLTEFPVGSFVKSEKGYFYIASRDKRFRFISKRVLDSWRPHRVILTSEMVLAKYRVAAKMPFRNGSLIHNLSDGKIYLISEKKRRHISNLSFLNEIGANRNDVVSVSLEEIKLHEEGERLN